MGTDDRGSVSVGLGGREESAKCVTVLQCSPNTAHVYKLHRIKFHEWKCSFPSGKVKFMTTYIHILYMCSHEFYFPSGKIICSHEFLLSQFNSLGPTAHICAIYVTNTQQGKKKKPRKKD